jgi:L-ascorbate 6-phosphate lactonase
MHDRLLNRIYVTPLGQAGFKFVFGETVIYVDPYLTDSVAEADGDDLRRMIPPPFGPQEAKDADYLLVSHLHLDHCDPATLLPIYENSGHCRFICPKEVAQHLRQLGIDNKRVIFACEDWIQISQELRILPIPAAHPEVEKDKDNFPRCVSFLIEHGGRKIYHGGDTSPEKFLIETLKRFRPIDAAFLPVNERNYYREKRGIIGNMSVREAFAMAEEIGVRTLVPTHWDLFAPNAVYRDEIELLYRHLQPSFRLVINPSEI